MGKLVIHAKHIEGGTVCGARSPRKTHDIERVTCGRCINILTKRIGIPR